MGERPRLVAIGGRAVADGRTRPAGDSPAGAAAAFGTLTITGDITGLSRAHLFGAGGRRTRVLLRFSGAAGERGPRGFAVKFHTGEGDWDLVGSNSPVSFRRDPAPFQAEGRSPAEMWDAWSRAPESLHQLTILFSDRGIPATLRHMHGFGGHSLGLINARGQRVWCRFRFRSMQGMRGLTGAEAALLAGRDRDSHRRDLSDAIGRGEFPRWRMMIQIMREEEARDCRFNPFDATRVWPHRRWPPIELGLLELNENPEGDQARADFSPAHLMPGIGPCPDPGDSAPRAGDDDVTQAGDLFRLMSEAQRAALMEALAAAMTGVPEAIQRRQTGHFARADPAYGAGVARRLGLRPALTLAAE